MSNKNDDGAYIFIFIGAVLLFFFVIPSCQEQQRIKALERARKWAEFKEGVADFFLWVLAIVIIVSVIIYIMSYFENKKGIKEKHEEKNKFKVILRLKSKNLRSDIFELSEIIKDASLRNSHLMAELREIEIKVSSLNSTDESFIYRYGDVLDEIEGLISLYGVEYIKEKDIEKEAEEKNSIWNSRENAKKERNSVITSYREKLDELNNEIKHLQRKKASLIYEVSERKRIFRELEKKVVSLDVNDERFIYDYRPILDGIISMVDSFQDY